MDINWLMPLPDYNYEDRRAFGEQRLNELKRNYRVAIIVFCVLAGLSALSCISSRSASGLGGMVIFLIIAAALYYGKYIKIDNMDIMQLGDEKINSLQKKHEEERTARLNKERNSPNRPIYYEFYAVCPDLQHMGFNTSLCEKGGRFGQISPVDVIFDERLNKIAICSLYWQQIVIDFYDFKDIIGCELQNNGNIVYVTKKKGSVLRGLAGYAVAGSVGAIVGSNSAGSETTSYRNDDFRVIVYCNNLSCPSISFEFEKDKFSAEKLYQMFMVIGKRNGW